MFLIHFAAIGYNLYFRGLEWHWIGILYLYIIWSSFKYAANYLRVDNPIISPKKNFETDCMRSWIASVFQIISKINYTSDFEGLSPQSIDEVENYLARTSKNNSNSFWKFKFLLEIQIFHGIHHIHSLSLQTIDYRQ